MVCTWLCGTGVAGTMGAALGTGAAAEAGGWNWTIMPLPEVPACPVWVEAESWIRMPLPLGAGVAAGSGVWITVAGTDAAEGSAETNWLYTKPSRPSMMQAVQSPERPVMIRALPWLYSPRISESELGPLRKRTEEPLIVPLVPEAEEALPETGALLSGTTEAG